MYDLYGVVNHIGGLGGGHYTAYAKHDEDWYLFNDQRFSLAKEEDLCTSEAYVLFYKRRKPKSEDDGEGEGHGEGPSEPEN